MATNDIANNYATALMESLKSPADLTRAAEDLRLFAGVAEQIPVLTRLLDHPGLPLEKRQAILDEVLGKVDPHPVVRKFLRIVVKNERAGEIPSILERFSALSDARREVESAEVITATPIDEAGRAEWERALANLAGKKVNITYRTDDSLLGGALTRIGSVVYDGSVRKQITRIRGVLLGE